MFPSLENTKIFLCREPVDMRKSYDMLSAMVSSRLGEDPLSGSLFVFLNRPRDRIKVLYFEGGGYCIWMKRLEAGTFPLPQGEGRKQKIDSGALSMLLEGLKIVKMKRFSLQVG